MVIDTCLGMCVTQQDVQGENCVKSVLAVVVTVCTTGLFSFF